MSVNIANQFASVRSEFEAKSYFGLGRKAKRIGKALEQSKELPIEAWSFVPHPDVLGHLEGFDLKRHIVTVDTQSSSVYFPVLEFLLRPHPNVTSLYSGGWADFVCDVQLNKESFERWMDELRAVLRSADAERLCPSERGVRSP